MVPAVIGPGADLDRAKLQAAARQLETLVLKQLVTATKAFNGGEGAGSAVRADLFAEALAGAMVKGGGLGLARQIENSVTGGARNPPATSAPVAIASLAAAAPAVSRSPAAAPAASPDSPGPQRRVTSPFGLRHDPFDGHLTRHEGVDLAGAEGETIRAVAGGVVKRSGERGGYGSAVEIDHGNGLSTVYAHASELLVCDGEEVTPGQPIARVGHTGRATGAHLHFEVRVGGRPVDPARALKEYALRADELIESGP